MRLLILPPILTTIAFGQAFDIGIRAGTPVKALLTASGAYAEKTYPLTVGPTVEFWFGGRLAVAADLLYKRMRQTEGPREADVHRFELPLVVKYRWACRPVQPYAGLGVSFNRLVSIQGPQIAEKRHRGTIGFVGAGGFEKRRGRLRFQPELRFSHWGDRNFGVYDAPLRSNLNQLEALAGFVF